MNKVKALICDLDGTMCNIDHRRHLIKDKKWDQFHAACGFDDVNVWCRDLVLQYWPSHQIIFLTGRNDSARGLTDKWLKRHLNLDDGMYILHMRPNKDYRKDMDFKEEIYREYIKDYFDVVFCLEDRSRVVNMWRRLGLVCLQCAPDEDEL